MFRATKISKPTMDTDLKQKPIFEWFVIRCGSKTGH